MDSRFRVFDEVSEHCSTLPVRNDMYGRLCLEESEFCQRIVQPLQFPLVREMLRVSVAQVCNLRP